MTNSNLLETAAIAVSYALAGEFGRLNSLLKGKVSQIDVLLSQGEDVDTWINYDDPDDDPLLDVDWQLRIAHAPEGTGRDVAFLIADSSKWWGLALRMAQDRLLFEEVLANSSRRKIYEVWTEFGFMGLYEGNNPQEVLKALGGEEAPEDYQIEEASE